MSYVLGGPLDFLQNVVSQGSIVAQTAKGQIESRVRGSSGDSGNAWDKAAGSVRGALERLRRQSLIGGSGAQYSGYANLVERFLKGDLAQVTPAMNAGAQWGASDAQAKPLVDNTNAQVYKMAEDVVAGKMDPPSGSAGVDDLARRLPELPKSPGILGGVFPNGRQLPVWSCLGLSGGGVAGSV